MDELFIRPDDKPMQFYLADLDVKEKTKYTLLIEDAGGRVENSPSDNILMFTVNSDKVSKYDFVFDVKFIDDCIAEQEILDIDLYYLGDERFNACRMCKFTMGISRCLCSTSKYKDICELVKNKKTMKIGSFKSTKSEDKQETIQKGVLHLKNNASQEVKMEINNKLKQTTLKRIDLDKNKLKNKRTKRNYAEDTGSETENSEINSSPVWIKRFSKTRSQIQKNKISKQHREAVEYSEPSTSKALSNQDYVVVISSDEGEDRSQKNLVKTTKNSKKVVKREKVRSKKKIKVKNEDDSEEEVANSQGEAINQELADFIYKTRKDKTLDNLGYPESESKNFKEWESQAIIDYLIISDSVQEAMELKTWRAIQSLKFLPKKRGLKLMYQHFIRSILPNIDSYNLSPKDLKQFKALKSVIDNSQDDQI